MNDEVLSKYIRIVDQQIRVGRRLYYRRHNCYVRQPPLRRSGLVLHCHGMEWIGLAGNSSTAGI